MKQRGFTLIEVMIVLAIFALIVLVAAPLSGGWVRDANLLTAESQLTEAIGRAKAAALRNKSAAKENEPATAICRSSTNLITVREGVSGTNPVCSGTPTGTQIWQAQLNTNITVKVGSTDLSCLCFNNKSALTTHTTLCSSCATDTSFILNAGGSHTSEVALY